MCKMVWSAVLSYREITVSSLRVGSQLTHHSGLISSYDGGICTRIEECRQTTSPSKSINQG